MTSVANNQDPAPVDPPSIAERLDPMDQTILKMLRSNGRASNSEIARGMGVTETTVRKRINNMLSTGLIEIVALPTPLLAGYSLSAIIGISVKLNSIRKVSDQVKDLPAVRYCGVSAGRYDLILEAFFSDRDDLFRFTVDVLGSIPEIISLETSIILRVEKFSYEW